MNALLFTNIMYVSIICTGETKTVFLQNCFSWRSNGQNEVCDIEGAYPGSSSKCDCAAMDLGIQIIGPTPAPSISTMPTGIPSLLPTTSTEPTTAHAKYF